MRLGQGETAVVTANLRTALTVYAIGRERLKYARTVQVEVRMIRMARVFHVDVERSRKRERSPSVRLDCPQSPGYGWHKFPAENVVFSRLNDTLCRMNYYCVLPRTETPSDAAVQPGDHAVPFGGERRDRGLDTAGKDQRGVSYVGCVAQ